MSRSFEEGTEWFRSQTLERWPPLWLFLHGRVIGVGWRGLLLIWRHG